MRRPTLPDYVRGTLGDLLPAVAAQLGVAGSVDRLGLPQADRYLIALVDGLGWQQLCDHADQAPFLSGLSGRRIPTVVPSTTATALTSLGTGLPPGQHGIAGYSFWCREANQVLNVLRWPTGVSGLDVQPQLTFLERLEKAGVAVASVAPAGFAGSGLTQAALRGGTFLGFDADNDHGRRLALAVQSVSATPALGYFYERRLDHAGHVHGVGSPQWLHQLQSIDQLLARIQRDLPADTALIVTADHGMVNIPQHRRLVVQDEPDLLRGVRVFAGEGRFRQLWAPNPDPVAARWRERLGPDAWVRTRSEAVSEGWFGAFSNRLSERFGDVLVAATGDFAVMTRELPRELELVGMHGSLTSAEIEVPLLFASPG